jgi:predicted NAD-dependent protein-ADP-ribosyltransferase YbiA (DUF1768 family)
LEPIPKDSAGFFRARRKNPQRFTFTESGDLQVPEIRGEAPKVIELPNYRPATGEELEEEVEKRRVQLKQVEQEFDETMRQYKEALANWRLSGASSEVIKYQRELTRLDATRTQLRSPIRWIHSVGHLSIRDLLVDEFHRVKKIGYDAQLLRLRSNRLEEFVKIGSLPTPPMAEGGEEEEEDEGPEESFLFFYAPDDPEWGDLSPDRMVEFVYNSTKYTSPTQAFEGERLRQLKREDIFKMMLKKSSEPTKVRTFARVVAGEVENPRELWIDILKALVAQHPTTGDTLRKTGTDTLIYANPNEGRYGIGLAEDDPAAMDREQWKGKNPLGQAWEVVRKNLPEEEEEEEEEGNGAESPVTRGGGHLYTQHGKTKEENALLRKNILKGYYSKKRISLG